MYMAVEVLDLDPSKDFPRLGMLCLHIRGEPTLAAVWCISGFTSERPEPNTDW